MRSIEQFIDYPQLPERLEFVKTKFGLSTRKLAAYAGMSTPSMSQILKGETKRPKPEYLTNLTFALPVNLQWLLTGKGEIDRDPDRDSTLVDGKSFAEEVERKISELVMAELSRFSEIFDRKMAATNQNIESLRREIELLQANQGQASEQAPANVGKSKGVRQAGNGAGKQVFVNFRVQSGVRQAL